MELAEQEKAREKTPYLFGITENTARMKTSSTNEFDLE